MIGDAASTNNSAAAREKFVMTALIFASVSV